MLISTFTSQLDNKPGRGDVTWEQLIEALRQVRAAPCTLAECQRSKCSHKAGASWSPASWPTGSTRAKKTVEQVSMLVVDLDHVAADALVAVLTPLAPYRHIVHASHSDRPDDRCLRVVVALSRPVRAADFTRFWRSALGFLRLPGDPATCDASRLYYRPSRPADACHLAFDGTGYTFGAQDGALLDVDAVLASAPAPAVPAGAGEFRHDVRDKMIGAAKTLGESWPNEGRHTAQLALAGALARAGWPVELIADFAAAVAEVQQPGNAMLDKRMKAARSSVEKVQSGEQIAGWPTLQNILTNAGYDGGAVVDKAMDLLGLRRGPRLDDNEVKDMTADPVISGPPAPAPMTPLVGDLDAHYKSVQRRLASRKDADSIRDAELLKRVSHGDFLTNDASEDQTMALVRAAIVVARAAPPGMTDQQMHERLLPSAGGLAAVLPDIVTRARAKAEQMPKLIAAMAPMQTSLTAPLLDEFVIETQGKNIGKPSPANEHNIRVALHRLKVGFRYNRFAEHEIIVRDGKFDIVEDHHVKALRNEIERNFQFKPPKDEFFDTCEVIAREDSFHPVLDYIDALPLDENEGAPPDLTETWLIKYAGAPDTAYVRAVSRLVLVAAVRRVRRPGCKFDEMLILETPEQGKNKSTALRALVPNEDWFTDDFRLDADDTRKMLEMTLGRWIVEAGELKGMSNGGANDMKQYLSRREDTARMAYGRKPKRVRRQFIIIGTTNEEQYLRDTTGNRRYWPIRVVEFDVEGLAAIRDQLWAEAARLDIEHPEDSYIRLDPSLYGAAADEQRKRAVQDPFQMMLDEAFVDIRGRIPSRDCWKLVGFHEEKPPSRIDQNNISNAMRALGFAHEQLGGEDGGPRGYFYVRGEGAEAEVALRVVGSSATGWKVRPVLATDIAPASQVPPKPESLPGVTN